MNTGSGDDEAGLDDWTRELRGLESRDPGTADARARRLREIVRDDFEAATRQVDAADLQDSWRRLEREFENDRRSKFKASGRWWLPLAASVVGMLFGAAISWSLLGGSTQPQFVVAIGDVQGLRDDVAARSFTSQVDSVGESGSVLAQALVEASVGFEIYGARGGKERQFVFSLPSAPDGSLAEVLHVFGVPPGTSGRIIVVLRER